MRRAALGAKSTMAGETRPSWTTTSARASTFTALTVSRSGSPGPAPTSHTAPPGRGAPSATRRRETLFLAMWRVIGFDVSLAETLKAGVSRHDWANLID